MRFGDLKRGEWFRSRDGTLCVKVRPFKTDNFPESTCNAFRLLSGEPDLFTISDGIRTAAHVEIISVDKPATIFP